MEQGVDYIEFCVVCGKYDDDCSCDQYIPVDEDDFSVEWDSDREDLPPWARSK